nr:type II toxin-antitoxin system RelE/ParE family toxin [Roseibacterium persicicum]
MTRQAEAALTDIARWTIETFGPNQAAAYEDDLIAVCDQIAAGTALTRACRDIIDPDLPGALRLARAGQHVVVFIEDAGQVIIVDCLHSRSDLPRRLAGLDLRG